MGKKTDKRIIDFLSRVKRKYRIDKAIFKGIFFSKRIALMYNFWKHYPLEIEPICYTPEEFNIKNNYLNNATNYS